MKVTKAKIVTLVHHKHMCSTDGEYNNQRQMISVFVSEWK